MAKRKTKGKKKAAPAPARPGPPRLGEGIRRTAVNRTRGSRGGGMYGGDLSMMSRSVLNTVQNLPLFLERHIDNRMQKMHDHLLFKADEARRGQNVKMEVDPAPPATPEVVMAEAPSPRQTPDVSMAEAPPSPMEREPLMTRQVHSQSSGSQDDWAMSSYMPLAIMPPRRITLPLVDLDRPRPSRPPLHLALPGPDPNTENPEVFRPEPKRSRR